MIYQTTRRVEFRHTDAAGIMHFSQFVAWMEECEHEAIRSLDLSVMMKDGDGAISWPRVSVACEFLHPVRFEDVVTIDVSIARLGAKSATYAFHMTNDGRDVAKGSLISVCCELRNDAIRPIPIPAKIREKLETLLVE